MDQETLDAYMHDGTRRGEPFAGSHDGAAGSVACGDLVRISLGVEDGLIHDVSFEAAGCGATFAAGAAAAEAAHGAPVLDAALTSSRALAARLGGLPPNKLHATDLASDALHRALTHVVGSPGLLLARPPVGQERVLVAMSGGVDSAVAALSELEAGREVVGVTLKLWQDQLNDGGRSCCSPEAVISARSLAHRLGIPHLTLDLREPFADTVVGAFVEGYASGSTPNPCVRCNGGLRIDAMLEVAGRLGAATLATGHYAALRDDGEGTLLASPADAAKDQTYMLSAVSPEALTRLRFPLAGSHKEAVRRRAEEAGLPMARKPESQDLCFLAGEGKEQFLARHGRVDDREGDLVDTAGVRVGTHRGHHRYTVGQRRGIGIASERPLYVVDKDGPSNTVTIGPKEALRMDRVKVESPLLWREPSRVDGVRLRSHAPIVECRATRSPEGGVDIDLSQPVFGVAPGQTACFMSGDLVVGSGTIAARA